MPKRGPVRHIVLSDDPERQRLRDLQQALEARRDAIAELDLEIETVRAQLQVFEAHYHAQMQEAHAALKRAEALVQHIERWIELLRARLQVGAQGQRLEERRLHEVKIAAGKAQAYGAKALPHDIQWKPPPDKQEQLKSVYRELARRFHPDLARDEATQLRNSQLMARINQLYRDSDLDALVALREQAKGAEVEDPESELAEQIASLQKRLAWFDTVLKNLQEERMALEQSATCELWRNAEQMRAAGQDLFAQLREEAYERLQRMYDDIPVAVRDLEAAVARYNRQQTVKALDRRGTEAMEQVFDPYVDKSLVRLGLDDLNVRGASQAVRNRAKELEQLARDEPALLRLVLLTAVSELSPYPLTGLETYGDLELRYKTLAQDDDNPAPPLGEALVRTDAWLEYGIKRASEKLAHTGLRFRADEVHRAVPLALRALTVRRAFKRVLQVLGEHEHCLVCKAMMFAVPLYSMRGLDDLRASVCPLCGAVQRKYWMPKGKDVQAVLNATFVDYEIISEWSFALARASCATQLVPQQVATLTLGALKKQLVADLFERNGIAILPRQIVLTQQKKVIPDTTPLRTLDKARFRMQFQGDAPMSEADALERVRHHIRNRFKA